MCQCIAIAGAFGQNGAPEPLSLRDNTPLGGKGRQIAPGQMPGDPLIKAAKLVGPLAVQDPPPALLSLSRLTPMPVHNGLAKPQFRIPGVELEPLGTSPEGSL